MPSQEVISLEECKKYVEKFSLSDDRILGIRNSMIGMVNNILNTYLDKFE